MLVDPAALDELRTWNQATPLMYAFGNGQTAMAHWLIEHRGQHNIGTRDREGKTVLHCACSYGSLAVVQALAAAGADVSLVDKDGWTPLICACLNNK